MNKEAVLSFLAAALMRALGKTLRVDLRDEAGYFDAKREHPLLLAAWHNRILVLPAVFERLKREGQRPLTVLTSTSRDGGLIAAVVVRFGVGAVRGSTSKRGATAVLRLADLLETGTDIIITPDGPRGPLYHLSPGIIFLAQKTGVPVMRIHVEYSRFWEVKSWDRFRIPKPFSRVVITLPPAELVDDARDDAGFEAARTRLEHLMREETARSEHHSQATAAAA